MNRFQKVISNHGKTVFYIIVAIILIVAFPRREENLTNGKTISLDRLVHMSPGSVDDYEKLGTKREQFYIGIIPEVAEAMDHFFKEGEKNVRDRLLNSFIPDSQLFRVM